MLFVLEPYELGLPASVARRSAPRRFLGRHPLTAAARATEINVNNVFVVTCRVPICFTRS